jgi:membrane-bound lytic murein transglycosylase D
MIESGFNPLAVSRRNAAGLWQFMVPTGREYGLITNQWIDERKDPVKSTYAAAAHLKDLYNLFGSWPLALASYNAGTGTVRSVVHRTQSDDYWDLLASEHFRPETRNYVPRYLAALIIVRSPEAYGFVVPRAEPFAYDEIVVRQSADLSEASHIIGCSYDDILELNPELIRKSTPPQQWYVLRIPPGTKSFYELRVAKLLNGLRFRSERMEEGIAVLPSFFPNARAADNIFGAAGFQPVVPRFDTQFALADDLTCVDCNDTPLFLHQMQYRMNEEKPAAF